MRHQDSHISDHDLLLTADGEVSDRRTAEVRAHLSSCWACRARMKDLEDTIADFIHAHQSEVDPRLSSSEGPRALLRARLAEAAAASRPHTTALQSRWAWGALAAAGLILGGFFIQTRYFVPGGPYLTPNPRFTPGVALPVSQTDVCTEQLENRVKFIPASVGRKVFEEYGIGAPGRHAYELDYLIAPELGGADDVRNFWPQPYSTRWNAHLKDALEDRLHQLVCANKISLATAQHDLSTDWISAYKKYFQTDRPIASHGTFTKDQPWDQ